MKALLLMGGFGTRLRPFTITKPKALLPIVNFPFVSYQFELLRNYGIDEVVLGIGYKGDEFKKILGIGKEIGLKIYLSYEKTPLGTGGAIKNAERFLKGKEPFFVFNGDIIANFNLEKILNFHKEKNAYITIGMVKVSDPSSYGLIVTDDQMQIKKFIEKPKPEKLLQIQLMQEFMFFSQKFLMKYLRIKKFLWKKKYSLEFLIRVKICMVIFIMVTGLM
jgi:Nucleoside-diphosphate-sugar pyrophosphorylase involved in lipopolysaccharide biosynthesis/translation initiation factor 2B, gamma/epsilon subunits (eIF-2Bgamma/eIF-2Bepsilon)